MKMIYNKRISALLIGAALLTNAAQSADENGKRLIEEARRIIPAAMLVSIDSVNLASLLKGLVAHAQEQERLLNEALRKLAEAGPMRIVSSAPIQGAVVRVVRPVQVDSSTSSSSSEVRDVIDDYIRDIKGYVETKRYPLAMQCCFTGLGARPSQLQTIRLTELLGDIGDIYSVGDVAQKDYVKALECYNKVISVPVTSLQQKVSILGRMANIYRSEDARIKNYEKAVACYDQMLKVVELPKKTRIAALVVRGDLFRCGDAYLPQDYSQALLCYNHALQIEESSLEEKAAIEARKKYCQSAMAQSSSVSLSSSSSLSSLENASELAIDTVKKWIEQKRYAQASRYCLNMVENSELSPKYKAILITRMGDIYRTGDNRNYSDALKYYKKALSVEELPQEIRVEVLIAIGNIYRVGDDGVQKNYTNALDFYNEALGMPTCSQRQQAEMHLLIGLIFDTGDKNMTPRDCSKALDHYTRAQEISELPEDKKPFLEGLIRKCQAELACQQAADMQPGAADASSNSSASSTSSSSSNSSSSSSSLHVRKNAKHPRDISGGVGEATKRNRTKDWYCGICDKKVSSEAKLQRHISRDRHQRKVAKLAGKAHEQEASSQPAKVVVMPRAVENTSADFGSETDDEPVLWGSDDEEEKKSR